LFPVAPSCARWRHEAKTRARAMNVDIRQALAETRDRRAADQLLLNARNLCIKNRGGAYYHKTESGEWKRLRGLLAPLRDTFWHDFDIKLAMKRAKRAGVCKPQRSAKGKGRFFGSIRGSETHQQLQDFVELDRAAFRKRHPVIHAYTRRILRFVLDQQWRPLLAEFDLYDAELGIGTSVDMVCLTAAGRLVFLEFKTGYAGYFKAASGAMHGALADLDNSPYHQAHVQLMTSVLLLAKSHGLRAQDVEMYVILVNDAVLSPHKINNEFLQRHGANIYRDLQMFNRRQGAP
jgi:hypothetical protein